MTKESPLKDLQGFIGLVILPPTIMAPMGVHGARNILVAIGVMILWECAVLVSLRLRGMDRMIRSSFAAGPNSRPARLRSAYALANLIAITLLLGIHCSMRLAGVLDRETWIAFFFLKLAVIIVQVNLAMWLAPPTLIQDSTESDGS